MTLSLIESNILAIFFTIFLGLLSNQYIMSVLDYILVITFILLIIYLQFSFINQNKYQLWMKIILRPDL
jgi:hypothetical protein